MYRNHTIGVVVPAYNEEGFVGDVVRAMPSFVDRIYVVDDRSTDDTWTEVLEAARTDAWREDGHPGATAGSIERVLADGGTATALTDRATVHDPIGRVVPIRHRENRGAGGAIETGYLAARADGIDVAVTVDGDGQMDLNVMPKLLDPIVDGTVDYAKGNRLLHDEYRRKMPVFRLFGNVVLSLLTKIASGYWQTSDSQNGYTAISRDALERLDLEGMYEYYGYCNDLLVKLNVEDAGVADVAIPAKYGDEESGIEYTTYVRKVSGMLLRNFLWRLKVQYLSTDVHPVALCYLFGAIASVLGVFGATVSAVVRKRRDASSFADGAPNALLLVIGCLSLLVAMLLDRRSNEDREVVIRE